MRVVAGDFVLNPQLFFLKAVEQVFVGVGAVLLLIDQRVKRCCLDSRASTCALSIGLIPFAMRLTTAQ